MPPVASPQFIGRIRVEQWRDWWVVVAPVTYTGSAHHGAPIVVPEGFITDFASIPRALWTIHAPTDPRWSGPGLVHDRLYETHETDRAAADAIFYEAMSLSPQPTGVDAALGCTRRQFYRAVRRFGEASYADGPARQAERRVAYRALQIEIAAFESDPQGGTA